MQKAAPQAGLGGCLVAPMVTGGVETILGAQWDPVFGPVVMLGLGGVFVEALKDVTFRLAPFDEAEARRMITELRALPVLHGMRGRPPADLAALARALADLSRFAAAQGPALASLDINPFLVLPEGRARSRSTPSCCPREPRASRWQPWLIAGLLFFFMFINFADKAVIGLAALPMMQDLQLSPVQWGRVGSSFFWLFSLSAIVVGFAVNRLPAKRVIAVMALIWALTQFPMLGLVSFPTLIGSAWCSAQARAGLSGCAACPLQMVSQRPAHVHRHHRHRRRFRRGRRRCVRSCVTAILAGIELKKICIQPKIYKQFKIIYLIKILHI